MKTLREEMLEKKEEKYNDTFFIECILIMSACLVTLYLMSDTVLAQEVATSTSEPKKLESYVFKNINSIPVSLSVNTRNKKYSQNLVRQLRYIK